MFKVLKNVPLPKTNRGDLPPRASKYPYKELEIGDMFFIPDKAKNTLSTHTSTIGKKLGRKFSTRLTYMRFVDVDGDPVERDNEDGFWAPAIEGDPNAVLGIGVWRVEPTAAAEAADAAPETEQETPPTADEDEDASAALMPPATAPAPARRSHARRTAA